jgi:hypothetical protein
LDIPGIDEAMIQLLTAVNEFAVAGGERGWASVGRVTVWRTPGAAERRNSTAEALAPGSTTHPNE